MSPLMQAILLFILAFLIGFFILYLWRKNAQAEKYRTAIKEQEVQLKENIHLLEQTEEKMQHAQDYFNQIHAQYDEQREILQHLRDEEATLIQNLNALEEEKKELQEKKLSEESQIETLQEKIEYLSKELNALQDARAIVAKNETEIAALKQKIEEQQARIKQYLKDIEKLKEQRKAYREESQELDSKILDAKAKLHTLETEIGKIKSKYAKTLNRLEEDLEDLKIRAINYEYAVKEYLHTKGEEATKIEDKLVQKLFKMPDSKSREIEEIVRKNDASRWIDTIRNTILKKVSPSKES